MTLKADLHLHTTASDGKLSPEDLVKLAKCEGLDIIAITDHDTTLGLEEALLEAELLSIKVIPGIELSTEHNEESVHILGYFRDDSYKSDDFQKFLSEMKDHRANRGKKIIENLNRFFDIKLDYADVLEEAKGVIARPHIARAIIKSGYNYDLEYIFNNLIGNNSPAYVSNKKLSTMDGITLLKSVNALVVLAHPILIKRTPLKKLMALPFDGIEAMYWRNSKEDTNSLTRLALHRNKIITGGSDFHGGDPGDSKHSYIGSVSYEEKYLSTFLKEL